MRAPFLALALALAPASRAFAGDAESEFVRVEVICSAVSGRSVYLDQGRAAGIEPGDAVRLFPVEGPALSGKILAVSRTSARVALDQAVGELEVGARGEVLVPLARKLAAEAPQEPAPPGESPPAATPAETPPPAEEPAAHPPWTAPPEDWNQTMPLLAPAQGVEPEDRPRRIYGRVFTSVDWTLDDGGSAEREYFSSRGGFDLELENPFGQGGELELDAEVFYRTAEADGDEDVEQRLRIDRASYGWGGVRGAPDRFQVGRFLQNEFPELGFLDGAEWTHRTRSGNRFGASAGAMPEPDDFFSSGDDVQAALYYRWVSGEDERFSAGTGFQKTWHEGEADRDLVVANVDLHPGRRTSIYSSFLVDYYTSDDDLKGSGFELTQATLNANHTTEAGNGYGLFASHFRWPDLERNEFPDVTALQIMDNQSTRFGVDGWMNLSRRTRLYGRVDRWTDQDDSGGSASARVTLRDMLFERGQVGFETFVTSGKYSDGIGVRANALKRLDRGSLGASVDSTRYEQSDFSGDGDLLQHALRIWWDTSIGEKWTLSVYAEGRLGDDQDARTLGFLLQRRF